MQLRKQAIFAVFAVILSCLAVFFIGEIILRIFPPDWLAQRMKELNVGKYNKFFGSDKGWPIKEMDGDLIVSFIPFSNFRIAHYEYSCTINIDAWGGRLTTKAGTVKNATLIPFLGDSVSFGLGVGDFQTYVSLLDAKSKVRYLNLGIAGTSLPNQLDIIEHRHKEFGSPALYVFNFCIENDFNDIIAYYRKRTAAGGRESKTYV